MAQVLFSTAPALPCQKKCSQKERGIRNGRAFGPREAAPPKAVPARDSARAIQALIANHRAELLAFVRRRVCPPIEAADIVQDIWTKALPAIDAGSVDNVIAYLYGVARNLSAEAMRLEYRQTRWFVHSTGDLGIADEAPSAHRVANAKDQLQQLEGAVGSLPDRCRKVFELRRIEQLGKVEIADHLGITTKQVEKQLRHALTRCRQILMAKNSLQDEGSKRAASPTIG